VLLEVAVSEAILFQGTALQHDDKRMFSKNFPLSRLKMRVPCFQDSLLNALSFVNSTHSNVII